MPGETQTLSHCLLWAGAVPLSSPDSLSGLGLSLPHVLGAHCGATPNPVCEPHPLEVQSLAWVDGGGAGTGHTGRVRPGTRGSGGKEPCGIGSAVQPQPQMRWVLVGVGTRRSVCPGGSWSLPRKRLLCPVALAGGGRGCPAPLCAPRPLPPPPQSYGSSSQAPVKGHLQEFPITPLHGAWPLLAHTLRCPVVTEPWLWSRPALDIVGLVWRDWTAHVWMWSQPSPGDPGPGRMTPWAECVSWGSQL